MALYEDDTMQLREQGAPPPDPSIYELKGTMGPVGQEQEYYERRKSPTVGQEQPQGMPAGGDINQFLDWAVKNKLGYNPLTMNPVTEAMNKWNTLESQAFQEVFGNSGITPNNMTPEALKHWNEQKREGLKQLIDEAKNKQATGMQYLRELREGWGDRNKIASWANIGGKEVALNVFGEIIPNPNVGQQMGQPVSPTAPPTAPPTPQQPMPAQQGQPQAQQMQAPQTQSTPSGALTRDVKPKDKTYEIVHTNEGYIGINKNDPNDKINYNVKKPLTADQQQALKQMVVINKLVKEIKEEFMDSDKGWGKNSYKDMTGVEGVTGWLRKRIGGTVPGAKYSEREAQFRAKVAQLYTIVYGFSGKQINEREIEKLKPFIPEVTDSDIDFAGKLRSVLQTSQDHINTTLEIAQKSGAALGGEEKVRIFEDKDPNSPTYGKRKRVYPDGREELF
jgi:hypothetical protein